jgi:hypothetical protein
MREKSALELTRVFKQTWKKKKKNFGPKKGAGPVQGLMINICDENN